MIWLVMLAASAVIFAASGIMWCALWIAEKLGSVKPYYEQVCPA